jgi:hypothetical protein
LFAAGLSGLERPYFLGVVKVVNLLRNYGRNMGGTRRALDAINATY